MHRHIALICLIVLGLAAMWAETKAPAPPPAAPAVNVSDAMLVQQWLTRDTVNFDNLKYTNTYPVLLYWSQCDG
ncbi:MAG: hypothetical protein ABIF71_02245 [Planctomycetota bacterium]